MKLTTLFAVLTILLFSSFAFAIDLTGVWCGPLKTAISSGLEDADNNDPPVPTPASFETTGQVWINILDQRNTNYGVLFYGYSDENKIDETGFSGVWDGESISFTHHDSVTRGTLKEYKKKPLQIIFINNVFDRKNRVGKTSVGVAEQGACD